ncbi:MAG TPA: ABC transporter ATP-binding protein [candidate division Zixibacteria bacterium]|nr:ABC transporter ATP-binding protein [candidate division Zixibacteria bacterium]
MFKHLRLIWPYLARYLDHLLFGLDAIVMTNVLMLLTPLVLRRAINRIESGGPLDGLTGDALLIVGLALVAGLFRFLVRRSVIWASRWIGYDLRGDLFRHVLKLDGPFFDRTPTGDIITRATSDIDQVRMMIGPGIMQGTNTLIVALVAIPLMLMLDWQLALYAFAPLPLLALATNLLGGIAHRRSLAVQESFSRLSASVQESLAGIRVLKSYAREADRSDHFRKDSTEYFELNMRLTKLWGAFMPIMALISGGTVILVLYFGGVGVIEDRLDLGTLVAFAIYLGMLVWPMVALGWVVSLYQRGTASLKRLQEIFDTQNSVTDPEPARRRGIPDASSLEFRHLSFIYPTASNGSAGLTDITFKITSGETVAIAGPTGGGKSTVAHLLSRRYPIGDGMMLLSGVDANAVPVAEWRRRIASVTQEPFLFSQTLRSNIAFGSGPLEDDKLVAIAEMAAFHKDVLEFPNRYETMVGERGITLSGGQKQRATIARALATDADVLILDDAFSAVDSQTEGEILDRLQTIFGTRIIILITHRIATLRRTGRVLFIENGRLADSGTHDEMVARGGAYARWVQRETILEELEQM